MDVHLLAKMGLKNWDAEAVSACTMRTSCLTLSYSLTGNLVYIYFQGS